MTEDATSTKKEKRRTVRVPIGGESIKQYKKASSKLHEYEQRLRPLQWPAPSKTVVSLIRIRLHLYALDFT